MMVGTCSDRHWYQIGVEPQFPLMAGSRVRTAKLLTDGY